MTVLALQIGGGAILAAALLQAMVGLAGQVRAAVRARRMDERKLAFFKARTDILIKRAQVDRERTQLTWAGKRKFRVVERRTENAAGDICSFYLAPHDGGALPPFLPGQFLTFELKIPDKPAPVVRCYSLSDSPTSLDRYRVTIKRLTPPNTVDSEVPCGVSSGFFHDVLKVGDVLDVAAPNGEFHLDTRSERPVVLIAGGVGLTPMMSMLKWLSDTDSRRETWLFYAARSRADVALRDEIRAIADRHKHIHAVFFYSAPAEAAVPAAPDEHAGILTVEGMRRYLPSSNYEFYVCGPPTMMESITAQLRDWGVPADDVHFEAFGPAAVKRTAKSVPHVLGATVDFARTGTSLTWHDGDGTLLELADAHGLRVTAGCRAGNCGTCATAVRSGKVSYAIQPASKPAEGTALLCIAYPDGDLILDA